MITVGLIGGIASGKSVVAKEFEHLGAAVLDGDKAGHVVLTQPDVIAKLVDRWGEQILQNAPLPEAPPTRRIDRSKIARIVFKQQNQTPDHQTPDDDGEGAHGTRNVNEFPEKENPELIFLESVTHPAIGELLRQQIAEHEKAGCRVTVLDAAVMLKAGWNSLCDKIVFVDVPQEIREQRAIQRGMSAEQFAAREKAQMPVADKKELADFIIDNSESLQKTHKQVEQVWHLLAKMA